MGAWHSVKEGCNVVCLNKAVGIMGVECVALAAVLLWLVLGAMLLIVIPGGR